MINEYLKAIIESVNIRFSIEAKLKDMFIHVFLLINLKYGFPL